MLKLTHPFSHRHKARSKIRLEAKDTISFRSFETLQSLNIEHRIGFLLPPLQPVYKSPLISYSLNNDLHELMFLIMCKNNINHFTWIHPPPRVVNDINLSALWLNSCRQNDIVIRITCFAFFRGRKINARTCKALLRLVLIIHYPITPKDLIDRGCRFIQIQTREHVRPEAAFQLSISILIKPLWPCQLSSLFERSCQALFILSNRSFHDHVLRKMLSNISNNINLSPPRSYDNNLTPHRMQQQRMRKAMPSYCFLNIHLSRLLRYTCHVILLRRNGIIFNNEIIMARRHHRSNARSFK